MDISDILGGVAEEHGILSSQCARVQAAASKLKGQTKLPKILQFNAHRARFFVATILSDEGAYGPVLVERKDGNISGLNNGNISGLNNYGEAKSCTGTRHSFPSCR
jgi:hypothetical protein